MCVAWLLETWQANKQNINTSARYSHQATVTDWWNPSVVYFILVGVTSNSLNIRHKNFRYSWTVNQILDYPPKHFKMQTNFTTNMHHGDIYYLWRRVKESGAGRYPSCHWAKRGTLWICHHLITGYIDKQPDIYSCLQANIVTPIYLHWTVGGSPRKAMQAFRQHANSTQKGTVQDHLERDLNVAWMWPERGLDVTKTLLLYAC